MLIGAHVREDEPLGAAVATESSCIQMFCGDPQSWKPWPVPSADVAAGLRASPIPVYVHSPYIVNLASPDNKSGSRRARRCRPLATVPRPSGPQPSS